jgi:Ulp1 family protease
LCCAQQESGRRRSQRREELRAAKDRHKCVPILSFPRNKPNAVTLTLGDVERLDPGQFLNDSLIDFW